MRGRELLGLVVLASGLIAASRLLVAGAYRALWDALWFGDWFPSVLGIVVFLVLIILPLGVRVIGWGTPAFLALFGLAGAFSDNADILYLASAPLLALGVRSLAAYAGLRLGVALAMGLLLDTVLRNASGGTGVFDHPLLSKAYGLILIAGSAFIAMSFTRGRSGNHVVDWGAITGGLLWTLLALELSLGYPNALLRHSGYHDYGPAELALVGGVAALSLGIGSRVRRDLRFLIVPGAFLIAYGRWGWIPGAFFSLVGLGSFLKAGVTGGRYSIVLAGLGFVVYSVMAVGVYTYPYLGLWPLADRLELVVLVSLLTALALSIKRSLPTVNEAASRELGVWIGLLIALAVSPALAFYLAPSASETADAGEGWVVVTYNIHQGFTGDARYNPRDVVSVLNSLDTRIACLQEVDGGRLTSAYVDLPLLLRLSGYDVAYFPAIEQTYGVAVAYKGVISGYQGHLLTSVGEQRAVIKTLLDSGWVVANAHLGLDADERAIQARELLEFSLKEPSAVILCGDFNEEEGEALAIISHYYDIRKPQESDVYFTCCLGEPTRVVIDYVAVLRNSRLDVVEYNVVWTWASDHLPVYAILGGPES